jgi:hypothetical protein
MKKTLNLVWMTLLISVILQAQTSRHLNASEIFQSMQQLKVLGSVLFIAAHPDDENSRLLGWLANERKFRTGYLSVTRGDGGQNLIGDEQGVDLGLIRTQELLAARRIDGAEQFFSRAFDFGFTKTTEEALATWNREKILEDLVWVIRQFQPDIIITRFPEDARAGHGHHSGSAVLAHDAFVAAADPSRFPDQLKKGVKVWQAHRILWNTFSFSGSNTTSEDQYKIDVGNFNPLLGKSYGEIAAESRSQHKSQGVGVPSSRGQQFEYFTTIQGPGVKKDLMEGINTGWERIQGAENISLEIDELINKFSMLHPEQSVPALVHLYQSINMLPDGYWKNQKLKQVKLLLEACTGLWMEASSGVEYAVQGDTSRILATVNNRSSLPLKLVAIAGDYIDSSFGQLLTSNKNFTWELKKVITPSISISQPYWLQKKMSTGAFEVEDKGQIGMAQNPPSFTVVFKIDFGGLILDFSKQVFYKYTDPVNGELFQPFVVSPAALVQTEPGILLFRKQDPVSKKKVSVTVTAMRNLEGYKARITSRLATTSFELNDSMFSLAKGMQKTYDFSISNSTLKDTPKDQVQAFVALEKASEEIPAFLQVNTIKYNHIPNINYFYQDAVKVLNIDLKTVGERIGYIEGAGDKVPAALKQMGYEVLILKEQDVTPAGLKNFDAVMVGVRAYNVVDFMAEKYDVLMDYVKGGGNLIVQYNTNNNLAAVKSKIGPYPFTISRFRVTDENAKVDFLLPQHVVLNYPNKITAADFDDWIQERGIYHAFPFDEQNYEAPLSMSDQGPGESPQKGSLIIGSYGKGKFVYTGLVFFRELPAGVPGAYRLLANIIALNHKK